MRDRIVKIGAKPIIIIIFVIVLIIGVAAYMLLSNQSSIPTEHTILITTGTATVNPKTHLPYQFTIPSDATSISVTGTFTAQGGDNNDVKVYIFDNVNFDKYKAGQSFTSLYDSGQIHSDAISASIAQSGDYFLVLDNKFSTVSTKTVDIEASATYLK